MFSSFMTNSWIAATLIAVTLGLVGFFVVTRGATFAAHALPLSAFPGAALASLLGINQFYGLTLFAGLGALMIGRLGRLGATARRDVATGLTLVALLALGILFLSMTGAYQQAVYALLFGQIFGIARSELAPLAAICVFCITAILLAFRPLLLSAAAPAMGEARGVSERRMDLGFLAILALAAGTALPVTGTLFVFSLAVAPAAAARSFTDNPVIAMLLSAGLALALAWASIALSYVTDWPVGFFIGGLGVLAYVAGRTSASFSALAASRR